MVLFKSPHRDLDYPTNITTWEWAFENTPYSPLYNRPPSQLLGAYINATTQESLDWTQVKENATLLSISLVHRHGLQPGDTVSLFSTNTIWYPVAMWATVRAGGRVNGASPAYATDEMTHALKTARSKILITLPIALPVALAAASNAGIPHSNILLLEGSAPGFTSIQTLISTASSLPTIPHWRIPSHLTNKEVCGYLNFSSGTTGLPKAVMLSHHNIIAQCLQLRQLQTLPSPPTPYKILAVMPLFHITGLVRFCHYPVLMNGFSIMLPKYTLPSMLSAIVTHEIPELILVPPILINLVRDPIVSKYDLSCVQRWSSGSAPISPEIIRALQSKFPWTGFRQGYGATESTACISCHPPSHYDYKYATTGGMLVANTVAKVTSLSDGEELGPNQTGEILARGPQIAMGYLSNPLATKESFDEDGFLHTGDVGFIDEEGLIHIEDRIKEMIKVKGQQVAPAELEDLLLGREEVEDAAVVGVQDERAGERAKGFVVLKRSVGGRGDDGGVGSGNEYGDEVEEKRMRTIGHELLRFVQEKKVRYKWLVEIEFVKEIPKSPTGKLLRRVLKTWEQKRGKDGERRARVREERVKL